MFALACRRSGWYCTVHVRAPDAYDKPSATALTIVEVAYSSFDDRERNVRIRVNDTVP